MRKTHKKDWPDCCQVFSFKKVFVEGDISLNLGFQHKHTEVKLFYTFSDTITMDMQVPDFYRVDSSILFVFFFEKLTLS